MYTLEFGVNYVNAHSACIVNSTRLLSPPPQTKFLFLNRLNYFRVCRIIVDHMPQVLREFFCRKYQWDDLPGDGNWFISNERWTSMLSPETRTKIEEGNTEYWDATTFFHVFLYSSHCLFARKIPDTQGSLQEGSNEVEATSKSADFQNHLKENCTVLFDLGKTFFISNVYGITQAENFFIKRKFNKPSVKADIYVCLEEWHLLKDLSVKRNTHAHKKGCSRTNGALNRLVQDLCDTYEKLNVPQDLIVKMYEMASGKCLRSYGNAFVL